jgi:hypothetical protein
MAAESTMKRTRIIALDFRNATEHAELGRQIAEMVRVIVPETPGFEVIDRGVIASRHWRAAPAVAEPCAARPAAHGPVHGGLGHRAVHDGVLH